MPKHDYWKLEKVEWENGAGIEQLSIFGIGPILVILGVIDDITEEYEKGDHDKVRYLNFAVGNTESIMKDTSDLMTIRQLDIIVDCLQGVGDAITNFQVELGIIDEMTEAAGEAKPQSTFEDPRFSEYVAQINIDGHNPVDILEAWLKEHNPEFLKDD